uniref:Crystallin lambda 1 n=1 Tax=Bos taurus TaxID=9913 RepID=A0AAA9TVL7_BOVIN
MASPGSSAPGGVAVVGSGLIGRSWAMLFASAGFRVKLFDIEPRQVTDALVSLRKEMKMLELSGYLKGELGAEEQLSLISGCSDLREAVEGALHVQECVPENLELKRKLFAQLDKIADDHVILSSSSSCLLPSKLFAGLAHVKQCLVAHPVNPPYYVPLVELVPHPETAPATVDRTYALMRRVGQSPVRLLREIDGFALNRLQYAVIAEAWRLVEEGVVSPGDLDLVMSDGLGLRYAFIGPLETMHLNAEARVPTRHKLPVSGVSAGCWPSRQWAFIRELRACCRKWSYVAAAAAKSLQSCPTLCDPVDGSPPGSPVPGILQARTLEWVAISFSKA